MKKYISILLTLSVLIIFYTTTASGEDNRKIAQTGMKFLSVSLDARASAMGNAITSVAGNSTSLFYNPASMARMTNFMHGAVGRVSWIADINYLFGSAAFNIANGQYGVFGISFVSVDYGDFLGTIRGENNDGFLDTGIFSPSAFAVGIGYAKALTEKFSVGGHVRYANLNLTGGVVEFTQDQQTLTQKFEENVMSFDFGILYKTGIKSLDFGMNIRNFSQEIKYIEDSFQLPLTFEIGLSFNAVDVIDINPESHDLVVSVDAIHYRDYPEQVDMGLEYTFNKLYSLRLGYTSPVDEQGISVGAGIKQNISDYNMAIDYAYTSFGVFEDVHRFVFQFSL